MAKYKIVETADGNKRLYKQSWFPWVWFFVAEYKLATYARKYVACHNGTIVKEKQHPMMRARRLARRVDKS